MTATIVVCIKEDEEPHPHTPLDTLFDMFLKYLDSFYKKYINTF